MTSITAADLKLGGRLVAAADAIAAGHLRRAAGIFNEVADDLNSEAEATTGLLALEDGEVPTLDMLDQAGVEAGLAKLATTSEPIDMQMCARNVHSYAAPDSNGWRHCQICGMVNVAPPENNGAIDMSARQ